MAKKTTQFLARNARLIAEAKAKREKLESEASAKALEAAAKLSNQPEYTTDECIHDILQSSTLAAKGGAGLVVNIFRNHDEWSLSALTTYFAAKKTQSVTKADGTKTIDKNLPTRPKMIVAFLSRNEEYKTAVASLAATKATLKATEKKKPVDHALVSELKVKLEDEAAPIKAAEAKLHRAFISAYQCRVAGYINVRLGPSNELLVTNADGVEKRFTESSVREAGTAALKEKGHITSRGPRKTNGNGETKAPSAVDAATAGPVIEALADMIGDSKKTIALKSEDVNVMTLEKTAELALATLVRITREDVAKSTELNETLSALHVELQRLIGTVDKKTSKKAA